MKINPLDFLREELDKEGSRHSLELTAFFTRGQGEKWAYTWDVKDVHDDSHPDYRAPEDTLIFGLSPVDKATEDQSQLDKLVQEKAIESYLQALCETFRMGTERKVHVHFYRSKDDDSVWEHKVTLDNQSIWNKFKDKMTSVFS